MAQPISPEFPSQCISTATRGQILIFLNFGLVSPSEITAATTVSTVAEDRVTIFAGPVNGFNVGSQVTSTGGQDDTNTSIPEPAGEAPSELSKETPGSGPSLGLSVGVSIGTVLGLILVGLGAWLFWRKRRRRHATKQIPSGESWNSSAVMPVATGQEIQWTGWTPKAELPDQSQKVHELYGNG